MTIRLKFHGAARTVTGSCYMLETGKGRILIDCGMFQGSKTERELNYRDFPFRPADVHALLLTHAHIDHAGLIPKLVKHGFTQKIYCTHATVDLCGIMLLDSGGIQEMEVMQLNRRRVKRGEAEVDRCVVGGVCAQHHQRLDLALVEGRAQLGHAVAIERAAGIQRLRISDGVAHRAEPGTSGDSARAGVKNAPSTSTAPSPTSKASTGARHWSAPKDHEAVGQRGHCGKRFDYDQAFDSGTGYACSRQSENI